MEIVEVAIGYVTVLLFGAVLILSYKQLTNQKLNITKLKFFLLIIFGVTMMINNIMNVKSCRIVTSYILILILTKLWFNKDDIKKQFYYVTIISIISMFIELVISKLLAIEFLRLEDLNTSYYAKNALTVIFNISTYFILMIKPLKERIKKYEKIVTNKKEINIFLVLTVFIINLILMQYTMDYTNNGIYLISIAIIIFVFSVILVLIKDKINKEKLKIKNKYLKENITNYEVIADDYSELKHNLNYDFMKIRSVANEEAQEMIDEIMKKYNKNYSWTTSIGKIPKGIQGMLCIKMYETQKEDINIEISSKVQENINKRIKTKTYSKLCDTLGITVDNAITAAKRSKERSVYIDMVENKEELEIKIMNTFKDILDLERLGTKKYSTKEKQSGIGLNYLNKIIKQDLKIKKEIINNVFIVSLSIPLKG